MALNGSVLYVGIMSGTSLDGIDTALVELADGQSDVNLAQRNSIPLSRQRVLLGLQPLTTTAYPSRVLRERDGERENEPLAASFEERPTGMADSTSSGNIFDMPVRLPVRLLATHYQAYAQPLKNALLALHHPTSNELHQAQLVSNELAHLYAAATAALLQSANIDPSQVHAIGCHGQTIRHRPEHGYTLQLGNAALLAELSGITVVSDFRSRDIAAGGQGAPLVPAFHDQALRHPDIHRVIVNIGGISNLTDLPPGRPTTGFDCGPGNLLMDAWIAQHRGEAYDKDGAWAASGQMIPALLEAMLNEPFLHAAPPKSSGRDLFNLAWLNSKLRGDEAPADVQATLLALTSHSIADAIHGCCAGVQELYLCGGGAHNRALVQRLSASLPDCRIDATDTLGMNADWVEAIAFAWLAQQAMHGHCANLPAVTGARHPCILGAIYQA